MTSEECGQATERDDSSALLDSHRGYIIDGDIYVVFRDRLYRRTGQTRNARALASEDAVGWNGAIHEVIVSDGEILFQHHMGGIREYFAGVDWFDTAVVTFEEVDTLGF